MTTEERISRIEDGLLLQKRVLTFKEACLYASIKPSYMYKLTSASKIAHYKPNNGAIYFEREELEAWLLKNRVSTNADIEKKALKHTTLNHK